MKTITFREAQNLTKMNVCKSGHGNECFVSIHNDKIIITIENTFYEFLEHDNVAVEFSENSLILVDNLHGSHTFYLFKLIPVNI